jgi:hypothetical protein
MASFRPGLGRWAIRAAPVAAETIGGTTGISHVAKVRRGSSSPRANIRVGIATQTARPAAVPSPHSTESTTTAAWAPISSGATSSAPAPTVSRAIGGAP